MPAPSTWLDLHTARDLVPLCAGRILARAGVPYTTQTHGMVLPDSRRQARIIDRLLTLQVMRSAKTRFVLTDDEDAALGDLLGPRSSRQRLPNGIALSDTPPPSASGDELDVLFMARLHPRKRVMDFAQAALTLVSEGHAARFSVVGPDDGDLPNLQEFVAAHPILTGRLVYEGALPHEAAIPRLARAGVFVLPSVDEPFPMTLLKALALGTPAICTNSCGIAADLECDGAALVMRPGAGPLESALRSLITDTAARATLADAVRNSAHHASPCRSWAVNC